MESRGPRAIRPEVSDQGQDQGEEVIYVLEGTIKYEIEGQGTKTVSAGEALTVPAQAVHSATGVGDAGGTELATFIVEKGKPLITLAE